MNTLQVHSRAKQRLLDVDIEIETERIERRLKLYEAQRKVNEQLLKKQELIALLEAEARIAELETQIREHQAKSAKTDKTDEELREYERQARLKQAKNKIDDRIREEDRIERLKERLSKRGVLQELFEAELNKLASEFGNPEELSPEQLKEYTRRKEQLEDRFWGMLDKED